MKRNKETWQTCSTYTYQKRRGYLFVKRLCDIVFSFLFIICFCWLFLIFIILSLLLQGPRVFYCQERYGKNGVVFKVIKFRTMKNSHLSPKESLSKDEYAEYLKNQKLKNDPRVTRLGKFYRKFSIDELPQIFNVLFGQMSFVGPRPFIMDELEQHPEHRDLLLKVRPGLTGFWATHGRSDVDPLGRIKMELFYVSHASLGLDIKIFFKTFVVAFRGKGAQ
ncbi:MAG: sugar transferase [Erysipelotrichaceae bacterium]|jgi:undecaprenyl-phosphate galactose phosphotransferase|nr:sugar transferase [Erysipelotrichaceae bacterium]